MNTIKQINQINQKELISNTSYKSSWHYDYRDTNYLYIGNIPFNLTEKDIIKIFSQYGIPTHINLIKDKDKDKNKQETEKKYHRGFGFLKYSNFKSCILAIDNFNGIKLGDRYLKVDHNYYKLRNDENEDDYLIDYNNEIMMKVNDDEEELIEKNKEIKLIKGKGEDKQEKDEEKDEFKDPMAQFLTKKEAKEEEEEEEVDDDFKDPMEQFIKDKKAKNHKHKSSHRSSGRSSHKHRSSHHHQYKSKDREKKSYKIK